MLFIVHVHVHVLPEFVEAFRTATTVNARASVAEPGVVRFDLCEQHDDPTRFLMVEAYRSPEGAVPHKATAHYAVWRDAVAPMMAEPRVSVKLSNVFPDDEAW